MMMMDVDTRYKDRPAGSHSKLSTFRDGFRILRTILLLLKESGRWCSSAQSPRP